jgi:type IV pilus assembly protein PilQ
MRLKHTLGILLPLLLVCSVAAAAGTRLTNVGVAMQGDATTVTLSATGAFTHTEYRPADNLLLVDLTGVSADKLDGQSRTLNAPGVVSYRVVGYRGANGAEVARLEITLSPGTEVHLSESEGGLAVRLQGPASAAVAPAVAHAKSSSTPVSAPSADAGHASASAKTVQIRKLAMVRGKNGMDLEIIATGPLAPKVMKLTGPDRLVLDVPNAIPAAAHTLAVHGDTVKDVRMARYQTKPPVTRIVVDLAHAQDYALVPDGNRLTLQLRAVDSAAPAQTPASTPAAVAEAAPPAETQPAPAAAETAPAPASAAAAAPPASKASDYLYVEPAVQSKPASEVPDAKPAPAEPSARAADAASKFASPQPEVALSANASMSPQPAMNMALQQQQQQAAATGGTPTSKPRYTGEPISVNLKDVDIKDFFRLIHDISGLNVVLDPAVRGNLTIVLDDVPWDQALDIVLQNNGLDRQLEGNVLRIATVDTLRKEADAKRAQIEAQRLAVDTVTVTRFLSYAHAEDVVPTIKKFLSARGDLVADKRTNALIISDIPSVFPQVDALLAKLDRKTQEVEIEARVVAATRNFARDIGTQLAFGWGNGPSAVGGASSVGNSPVNIAGLNPLYLLSPGGGAAGSAIPLFSNLAAGTGQNPATSGITFTNATNNYRLDFILTMAETRGLLKILSRPRIVTQNNIQAVVRQGVRVPVVTAAQLGGPPTVQYVDAFLRLTVTPQITAENTIFLNVDVENTTPDFTRQVQGNPTLITQQATTQVLVTDGGTVVIGGVIQTQNQVNIQQVPLLGNIPVLGNVFKRRTVSTTTQELIFFITPKIIQT